MKRNETGEKKKIVQEQVVREESPASFYSLSY